MASAPKVIGHFKLSNGETRPVLEGMDDNALTNYSNAEEGKLVTRYSAQAKAQGSPVTAGSKVYSQSDAYPNNWQGNMQAKADHYYPGLGKTIGAIERMGTPIAAYGLPSAAMGPEAGLALGGYDLTATGVNALKRGIAGGGDILPTYLGSVEKALNTPAQDPNAGFLERTGELVPQVMALGPRGVPAAGPRTVPQVVRDVATSAARPVVTAGATEAGREGGGWAAKEFFGPNWEQAGELAGATGLPATSALVSPSSFASRQAPNIAAAAERQPGYDENGRPTGESMRPSFGTLSDIPGRRLSRALGSAPFFIGAPVRNAQERVANDLQHNLRANAEQVAGNPLPDNVDAGFIGSNLKAGARTAADTIRAANETRQNNFTSQVGASTPVSVLSIIRQMGQYMNDPANNVGADVRPAIEARLSTLWNMTRGSGQTGATGYQPSWNMPSYDTVPWGILRSWASKNKEILRNTAPGQAGPDTHTMNALDDIVTATQQQAADNVSPGLGSQFKTINNQYAYDKNYILPELERVGGVKRVQTDGQGNVVSVNYDGGLDDGTAAGEITNRTKQAGTNFIDIASTNPAFPQQNWRNAAGGYISLLGRDNLGNYRPDKIGDNWSLTPDDMKDALTLGPGQAPLAARSNLDDLALISKNTVVPQQRHGMTEAIGAATGGLAAFEMLRDHLEKIGIPGVVAATVPPWLVGKGMESDWFTGRMGQQPGAGYTQSITDQVYHNAPVAASSILGQGSPYYYSPSYTATQPAAPAQPPPNVNIGAGGPPAANAAPASSSDIANQFYPPSALPNPLAPSWPGGQ